MNFESIIILTKMSTSVGWAGNTGSNSDWSVGNWGGSIGNWSSDLSDGWGSISDWSSNLGNGWDSSLHNGSTGTVHNSIESIDWISSVGHSTDRAIRFDQRVLSLDNISITAFLLSMLVTSESISNGVSIAVVRVWVEWLSSNWDGGWIYMKKSSESANAFAFSYSVYL